MVWLCPGHWLIVCSFVRGWSISLATIYSPLFSLTHFLTLLISPLHNLPLFLSLSLRLPPNSLSGESHFAVYCWGASEFMGEPAGLKTQAGVSVVAAERDGYNNPCSGSTHVLNYCHKCSSIGPRQDRQSHSAISSPDALSLFCYIIVPWPSASNKSSSS